ncbi:MAG: hypothetical protein D6761_02755 [Candidatus Dadabacteria bacterium]|nr:MAG: hypothetical protein D6761_02755 [Candidatus Dadabacteria bacterium]
MVGQGCSLCEGRGIHGRIAIVDALVSTPETRKVLFEARNMDEAIDGLSRTTGWVPFVTTALMHVENGEVPLSAIAARLRHDQARREWVQIGHAALEWLEHEYVSDEDGD